MSTNPQEAEKLNVLAQIRQLAVGRNAFSDQLEALVPIAEQVGATPEEIEEARGG